MITDLYKYIDTWDGKTIFIYSVLLILILWYFSNRTINLNILFGLIIAVFVISYLNHRSITELDTDKDILKTKTEIIKPTINDNVHRNVIDFLFSIQDYYRYNPIQYEEMVKSINQFYELFDLTYIDNQTAQTNYGLMEQYKRDALNALKSLIFKIPSDKRVMDKLDSATTLLDEIMSKDLDKISYVIDDYNYKNGYNVKTKMINYGPKEYNAYDDMFKNYSYELF